MGEGNFAEGYAIGRDSGNGNNNNGMGWGGDWAWWIVILLIFGWGNGGFGGWGNNGGGSNTPGIQGLATRADINEGFALNGLQTGISGLRDGQMGIQQSLCQGFNGVNTAILQSANGTERQLAQLGYEMSNCCCQTQRAIDGVNYNMATNTCNLQNTMNNNTRDIIDSQRNGTSAILEKLSQIQYNELNDKYQAAMSDNQALRFQASQAAQNAFITANQEAQTAELIRRLGKDCPIPAYVVPNPNCCYGNPVGVNYGGCGCGSL